MPTIRVTCPACGEELEIDAVHAGEEVECGSCSRVFVAEPMRPPEPKRAIPVEDEPVRPRRPRPEYDSDDRPRPAAGGSTAATISLILGILSLPVGCCACFGMPVGVAGLACGVIGLNNPNSQGAAVAGIVLSSLGLLAGLVVTLVMLAG